MMDFLQTSQGQEFQDITLLVDGAPVSAHKVIFASLSLLSFLLFHSVESWSRVGSPSRFSLRGNCCLGPGAWCLGLSRDQAQKRVSGCCQTGLGFAVFLKFKDVSQETRMPFRDLARFKVIGGELK